MSLRSRGLWWVFVAYASAITVASLCVIALPLHPLWAAAMADVAATVVVFAFSLALGNSSVYDPYWSVAPPCLGVYWWLAVGDTGDPLSLLALGLVFIWSVRLTWNWARRWQGLQDEDWRYRDLARRFGSWYWPVSFFGIHLMPTVLVFAGCVPLFYLLQAGSASANWWLVGAAGVLGMAAVGLETRADLELDRFVRRRESRQETLSTDVWRWCRHPNYLGELGFWAALGTFALAAGVPWLVSSAGILAMLALFVFVSIPMIERKLTTDKPAYARYQELTRVLLPFGAKSGGTLVWDLPLRVWHWLFALGISGSLYTGLSGDIGLMDRHQLFGYCLLGLLVFRVGWAFWGGRYARLGYYRISPREILSHLRGNGSARPHTAPGAAIAVAFVALVFVQAATGLFSTDDIFTEGPLTGYVSAATSDAMTWVHHRVFWLVIAAVAVHLLAHLVYACRGAPTPLAMFTGRKPVDMAPTQPRLARGAITAAAAGALVWAFLELV